MPLLPNMRMALLDALNSTGRVTIWNNTAKEKAMIPRFKNSMDDWLLKSRPIRINGHAIVLPKFATGTSAPRILSGAYPVACWIACPQPRM